MNHEPSALPSARTRADSQIVTAGPASGRPHGDSTEARDLFEHAPDAYLLTDRQGVISDANIAAGNLFGMPRHFLLGKPLPLLIPPKAQSVFYTRLGALSLWGKQPAPWEAEVRCNGGAPKGVAVAVTLAGEVGHGPQLRWHLRDLTAAQQIEGDLRRERALSDSLLECAEAVVLVLSSDGKVVRHNLFAEAAAGITGEEIDGQPWWQALVATADQPSAQTAFASGRSSGRWDVTCRLRPSCGPQRTIHWSAKPLGESAPGMLVLGHDVTALTEAQRHAVQAERLASIGQLTAGLAHESRNILQRAHACLAMLRWRCEARPELLELIDRLGQAQGELQRLYEDVREYAAPLRLEHRLCHLGTVWREVWAGLCEQAPGRATSLIELADGVDLRLLADPFRLTQVFRNVLENSLQAAEGPVRVLLVCRETSLDGRPALRVSLCDDGPGLGAEQRRRLFEPLYTTKTKGTGLGMAIVKRIVEAHGGRVAIADRPGPGAEIVVTLPRSPS